MRGPSAATAGNKAVFNGQGGPAPADAETRRPARGGRHARPGGRRWPYAWLAAPVAAALAVALAATVHLQDAGTAVQAGAVTALLCGSAVLAVTPGVALVSVAARYFRLGPATALGLLYTGAGAAAMAGFWAWFARPKLGVMLDAAMLAACVVVIAVFGRRGDLGRFGLSLPLALALAVSALYTGIAFLQGGLVSEPSDLIGHLYWTEPDNTLPMVFAAKIAAHSPLGGYMMGDWLSSDRPPLQTGFVLLQWPLWTVQGRPGAYQFLGTMLQSAWLPALWMTFRVRGVPVSRTCVAVLATSATGVMFFNTVYIWPKMLAGALALAALAVIVSRDPADRSRGAGVIVAALAALSMLAHGGTLFALLALVPLVILQRRKVTAWAVAACAAAAAVLYVPWMLYQHFVNPPGNRLEKWMLAGVIPIDRRGVLQTIIDQYRSVPLTRLLGNKLDNLTTLVANMGLWQSQHAEMAWIGGFLGYARIAGVNDLLPAAGPLLLGAVALLLPSARRGLAHVRPLAAFTALAVAAWVVLLWGGQTTLVGPVTTQLHQGPYAAIAVFIGLCALAVTALPPVFGGAVLAAGTAWFAVEWLPGLAWRPADPHLPASSPVDWSMAIVCGCALAAIIVMATAACRKPSAQEDDGERLASGPYRDLPTPGASGLYRDLPTPGASGLYRDPPTPGASGLPLSRT
jgi:hypothetical protein